MVVVEMATFLEAVAEKEAPKDEVGRSLAEDQSAAAGVGVAFDQAHQDQRAHCSSEVQALVHRSTGAYHRASNEVVETADGSSCRTFLPVAATHTAAQRLTVQKDRHTDHHFHFPQPLVAVVVAVEAVV